MPLPPSIPVNAWWTASIAATLLFLLFFVPLMPNRKYRIQISLAPVIGIVFVAVSAALKKYGLEESLMMYAILFLAFPLAFLGRRRELREKTLVLARDGKSGETEWSMAMQVQVTLIIGIVCLLGAWLSMAS
ncbi:hypothetical protein ACFY2W_33050 [Streptomyces sp. NPDC001262]|uniref:hypothetical protein n=1 Tax=Streptomyces sp. NPDC001262 TaxID=3364552 RepID=UPI003682D2FA